MSTVVMIPSRMASTRFPGKPLADIGGKPMVVRVREQAEKANVGPVWVAAGDEEIKAAVEAHGGQAILTNPALANGSDRIWAGVQALIQNGMPEPEIIINAQGDEPLLPPELLTQAVAALQQHAWADVVTFAHKITSDSDLHNPTKVKAVCVGQGAYAGRALYFSRSLIPHGATAALRHIGFYAYRYAALKTYVATAPGALENTEKLEQLRGLELGLKYLVLETPHEPIGVDTPADLHAVLQLAGLLAH
jgi:3-deoxy-manno-octulosonate cytidylyltransferase (CMP-KDO synthetase)